MMEQPKGCLDLDTMTTLMNTLGFNTAREMPHIRKCSSCRAEFDRLVRLRAVVEEITPAPVSTERRAMAVSRIPATAAS